jgi:ketosteroid isomerase-like protein
MHLPDIIKEYKALVEAGNNYEVIEQFYHDDIVQIENNGAALRGKPLLLEMEKSNIASVYSFNQEIISLLVDERTGIAMGEMVIQLDSREKGRQVLHEAFVQHWTDNKIKYQRFYYGEMESQPASFD